MLTRRHFIGTGALLLGAPALIRAQSLSDDPFALGVTSGEPAADGFVIWTRLAPRPMEPHGGMTMVPQPVQWEVAADPQFRRITASGDAVARPELGHSVHVEVAGLAPDRPYWYRFTSGAARSPVGRARTLPLPSVSPKLLRFGVAGCQNYEDGLFTAYRHLAGEDLAFVYHYGDFIYEGASRTGTKTFWGTDWPVVRRHVGQECFDLADYRQRYSQYLSDPDLRAARAAQTWLPTFDDHEVANNWADEVDAKGAPPELFRLRRIAALQAWYEFMPVRTALLPRPDGTTRFWRGLRYGDLLSMDLLDTRSARTDQPCDDGFKPACPAMQDPAAHLLSAEEEDWLTANLHPGQAHWNCLAQQVMMMAIDRRTAPGVADPTYNMDSWAGYEAARRRLLARMAGLRNVVVLTGDEHQNFAGVLDDGSQAVAVEFVSTSISSGGDGSDLRPGSDMLRANNPQLRFLNDQRGYLVCDVAPEAWRTHFMVVDRVSTPGGALTRRATATVARGNVAIAVA